MRFFLLTSFFCFFIVNFSFTQNNSESAQSPMMLAQKQLDAYNNGDIEAFMEVFHEEISIWDFNANSPSIDGFENAKKRYKDLFNSSPNLHCEVVNRSAIGNKVLDYEIVTGIRGSDEVVTLIMVYEIKDGKIWKATAIRP